MEDVDERIKRQKLLDASYKAAELEEDLFGEPTIDWLGAEETPEPGYIEVDGAEQATTLPFWIDRGEGENTGEPQEAPSERRPAWDDNDDDGIKVAVAAHARLRKLRKKASEKVLTGRQYEQRLREQHQKLNPRTAWAVAADTTEGDSASRLLRGAGGLVSSDARLPPGHIEVSRLQDANIEEPNESVVRSVQFHPLGTILMTAGMDKRIRLFKVDGVKNKRLESIYLSDMPVHKAQFANGGTQIVASGRRNFFYVFDVHSATAERVAGVGGRKERSLESFVASPASELPLAAFLGNEGCIPLLSLKSRQWVGTLKMSGTVRSATFSRDGTNLLTSGSDGVVHTWDMRMQRCIQRQVDEGCINSTALSLSANGMLLATGSSSGVVNLYNRKSTQSSTAPALQQNLAPFKSLMNLTTSVDHLCFSPDSQVLCMASRLKKDALRLVHTSTGTVFSNWPTSRSPVHYVHSVDFSPKGGLLAIGNAKGRVLLYRLHHYPEA